jgi:23S rRNA (cytidine2498-2'-O)-methyltransferase
MSKLSNQFVFMTCRPGAEGAVKAEVARVEPAWRFSFSRPGFLTFKLTGERPIDDYRLAEKHWTFAHAHGMSLGRESGDTLEGLTAAVWNHEAVSHLADDGGFADIHVWQIQTPSDEPDDEPQVTPLCREIEAALRAAAPESCSKLRTDLPATPRPAAMRPARRNGRVLDVIVVAPGEWWIGYHRAVQWHERWPGGAIPAPRPDHAVSRAYSKMNEALAWSNLPLAPEDEVVEVGCAPGGASQALLERGLFVTGIDPADVDPAILEHPRFRHLKKRGHDVRRKEFEGVRWLVADMNIPPDATLDEIEAIVTHPGITIRGMVLTLKFSDWKVASQLPEMVARVRGWGYRDVRTRQLTSGGQEVCLVALRRKALRRLGSSGRNSALNKSSKGRRPHRGKKKTRTDQPHSSLPEPHF